MEKSMSAWTHEVYVLKKYTWPNHIPQHLLCDRTLHTSLGLPKTLKWILLLFLLYKWGYWSWERLSNLSKVIELISSKIRIQTHNFIIPRWVSWTTMPTINKPSVFKGCSIWHEVNLGSVTAGQQMAHSN